MHITFVARGDLIDLRPTFVTILIMRIIEGPTDKMTMASRGICKGQAVIMQTPLLVARDGCSEAANEVMQSSLLPQAIHKNLMAGH